MSYFCDYEFIQLCSEGASTTHSQLGTLLANLPLQFMLFLSLKELEPSTAQVVGKWERGGSVHFLAGAGVKRVG